jgi:RNA polymerase sigma factor (sigma-70 family)
MLKHHGAAAAADTPDPTLDPAQTLDRFLAEIERRAFRFAEFSLDNREDALDAVQDSMIKLMAYRERPCSEWTPLFWSILRSSIIDAQRRGNLRLRWFAPNVAQSDRGQLQPDWADDGADPARAQEGLEAYGKLVDGLRGLPGRQREAFTLRILEDLDGGTTARIMGCSEGAVKTHLARARDALQRRLEDWR